MLILTKCCFVTSCVIQEKLFPQGKNGKVIICLHYLSLVSVSHQGLFWQTSSFYFFNLHIIDLCKQVWHANELTGWLVLCLLLIILGLIEIECLFISFRRRTKKRMGSCKNLNIYLQLFFHMREGDFSYIIF